MGVEETQFIDSKGKTRSVAVETIKPLGKTWRGGSWEALTHLVSVKFSGREGETTMVRKTILGLNMIEPAFEMRVDPRSVLEKWKKLAQAGVSVDDEIEISVDNTQILQPELSQGGRLEMVDFDELVRLGKVPDWMRSNRKEVFTQLIRNFELATSAGYSIYPDSWFVTYDKTSGAIKVILRDLGQGVLEDKHVNRTKKVSVSRILVNIVRPLGEGTGIYTQEEWKDDFPEYTTP